MYKLSKATIMFQTFRNVEYKMNNLKAIEF